VLFISIKAKVYLVYLQRLLAWLMDLISKTSVNNFFNFVNNFV